MKKVKYNATLHIEVSCEVEDDEVETLRTKEDIDKCIIKNLKDNFDKEFDFKIESNLEII